ncbi:MAG: DUF2254 domain-containing protein [Ilumatobacteraceae bacterium]
MDHLRGVVDSVRASFFVLPAVAMVVAFVGGRFAVGVDVGSWVGEATVNSSRAVLSTVAAATITFASITFSVALLIMQQGSAQFSPRVIPGLTRDPFNRRVIAVVVGTFTYCLVVLQRVRAPLADDGEAVIPSFAVSLGLVFGLGAVLAVVAAIHHTAQQMDVSKILGAIVTEAIRTPVTVSGLTATDRVDPPAGLPSTVVRFDESGWVRQVDVDALIECTPPGGATRLETIAGRYAIPSTILATIWPAVPSKDLEAVAHSVRDAVKVGPTRTMVEDAAYGIRQLVDVALKALSPGINDPTTAQDAIFHLGTLLVERLTSPLPASAYQGDDDRRLLMPQALTDRTLAELAFGELRMAAADKPAVCIYLFEMIADVSEAIHGNDRDLPLVEQAALLLVNAERAGMPDHEMQRVRNAYTARFGNPTTTTES